MKKKAYSATLHPSDIPISEPVAKFGGQPVWVAEPEWPLSRQTGKPMSFICQVELYPEIFEAIETKMAYIFMTDDEDVDGTWENDGGENAVIMQPAGANADIVQTQPLQIRPT